MTRTARFQSAAHAWGSSVKYRRTKDRNATSFEQSLDFRCHGDHPPTQTDDPRFSGIKHQIYHTSPIVESEESLLYTGKCGLLFGQKGSRGHNVPRLLRMEDRMKKKGYLLQGLE